MGGIAINGLLQPGVDAVFLPFRCKRSAIHSRPVIISFAIREDSTIQAGLTAGAIGWQEPRRDYAVASTGAIGCLYLHSPLGHCANPPALSHFSIM